MEEPARAEPPPEEDRLVVRLPAPGFAGSAGLWVALAGALLALGLAGLGDGAPLLRSLAGGAAASGLAALALGLRRGLTAWRVEATPHAVRLVREGLLGERLRGAWPAWDVASFWVNERGGGNALIVGFANGRHERLRLPGGRAELQALAERLRLSRPRSVLPRDPPGAAAGAAETLPPSVDLQHRAAGFAIRLRPNTGIGLRVVLPAVLAFVALVLGAVALPGAACWLVLPAGSAVLLAAATARASALRAPGLVEFDGDLLRVAGAGAWPAARIEHVQMLPEAGGAELQVLLKGREKLRLLQGRPPGELEWLARFLRKALWGPDRDDLRLEACPGNCPVCGEAMTARVVVCARCRTPHHAECWAYVGQCSTYGCREIGCIS
jgi:hypothetical protein